MSEKALSKLDKLKAQHAKIAARIQNTEARLKMAERKKETRRKILVGSYYLDEALKKGQMEEIKKHMDKFLTRNSDRSLFDLPLLENVNA